MKPLSLNVNAGVFTPGGFKPTAVVAPKPAPPVDTVGQRLKALKMNEEEITAFKEVLKLAAEDKTRRKDGPIGIHLFDKISQLKLCQNVSQDAYQLSHCLNEHIVSRKIHETVKSKGGKNYNNRQRPQQRRDDNDNFNKGGSIKKDGWGKNEADNDGTWKMQDTTEKAKLKEKARAMHEKVKLAKNEEQQIRLILNVITPDNYDKKFRELRQFLFGDLRSPQEMEDDGEKWNEENTLNEENFNTEVLQIIVQNIFRKAQVEKEYTIFYGDICEKMIKLELSLRNMKNSVANMKQSAFRKMLFEVCKQCFEKFFNEEEKAKTVANPERAIIQKQKLFGNLDFVGELYRRKMLPETVLISVFNSLLGFSEINTKVDDLMTEGATNLMNKVGQNFEERSNAKKKKDGEENSSLQNFNSIINKFTELMNGPDETILSNRVKLLIKNMFANRTSGWAKTKDLNEGGPKTKSQVAGEVQDKYEKERAA